MRIGAVLAPPRQKATLVATVQRSITGIAPIPIRVTLATTRPAAQTIPNQASRRPKTRVRKASRDVTVMARAADSSPQKPSTTYEIWGR